MKFSRCSRPAVSGRERDAATQRRGYSAGTRSQIEQLQPARHLRGNALRVIKGAADRRDVARRQPDCGSNEIMVAEHAVGRVEAYPAGAGKKNFRPGVERT